MPRFIARFHFETANEEDAKLLITHMLRSLESEQCGVSAKVFNTLLLADDREPVIEIKPD